jgi:TRAP-type transport system periplasmic protein
MKFLRRHLLAATTALAGIAALGAATDAQAQQRKFTFGYDQPRTTAYGIAADVFDAKLKEVSGGRFSVDQFPGAQLGQEPVMLQKLRAGDIDFIITSTANASTVAPQSGVFSLHFIFRDDEHLAKVLADPNDREGLSRHGRRDGPGRACDGADDDGLPPHLLEARVHQAR